MPDHVHLVLTPSCDDNGPLALRSITQAIKSEPAHRINKLLGRRGPVWQDESFDHVLRSEERLDRVIEYILENPVRDGLVTNPLDYRWLWKAAPEVIVL
jgi:REP element-mobilizing transposase RayT